MRGCAELVGKALFDCHKEASREKIIAAVEKLKDHANEIFLGVGVNNQRIYINPVCGGRERSHRAAANIVLSIGRKRRLKTFLPFLFML